MIAAPTLIDSFAKQRVLLIGDTILDVYTYGTALGLSVETPTIVAAKQDEAVTLGGAAFVCRNLLALGATVDFITLTGDDDEADTVARFAAPNLTLLAIRDPGRKSTVKSRFWVDGYKLLQLETLDERPIAGPTFDACLDAFDAALPRADKVVIADYRHGLLSEALIRRLVPALDRQATPWFVDSQIAQSGGNHQLYQGGGTICLNLKEARSLDPAFAPSADPACFAPLRARLNSRSLVVKLGADGAILYRDGQVFREPAIKASAVDVTGAGDAFLAALALAGVDEPATALRIANAWAGYSVEIHGTIPPPPERLSAAFPPPS
jgi:D-beta-D-heptose 7-phosphate kinase/D-beta-D-heptose 1-phosphate adenosyltransferase